MGFAFAKTASRGSAPAYASFTGRVTQSMIAQHGSYAAARAALDEGHGGITRPAASPEQMGR